ncbi:MAG TPA: hypothetical protein EYP85_07240 [Armatimonadetes bacterium]|nr:hypothetical protein [Armatimonadota bacterium]
MPEEIQFRPSLIIGLGGTGKEVVLDLKERFVRNFGEELSLVRFLVFDTTLATEDREVEEEGRSVQLSPIEFVYLGNIDANDIVENLRSFPSIRRWFPQNLRPGVIDRGAAMVRAIGRLALFWKVHEVSNALDAAVRHLMRLANIPLGGGAAAAAQEQGLNIFVVTSVCGGTGGGMFLDVAYLVRDTLRQVGLLGVSKVTGALVLPGAFPRVADPYNLQANAYAALKELDYFMENAAFRCQYSETPPRIVDLRRRPFDICYLLDTINENRRKLEDVRGVAQLIAEALFLFITSDTGKKIEDLEINVRDRVLQFSPPPTNKVCAYSSFGTSALVLPTDRVIRACAYTLGADLIEQGLLRPVTDLEELKTQVRQFIDTQGLREDPSDDVVEALLQDERGRTMRVSLDAVDLFATPGAEVLAEAKSFVENYRRSTLGAYEQRVRDNAQRLEQEKLGALEQQVETLVNDPERGLLYAHRFLEELNRELEHFWNLVREEQEQQEKQRAAAEQQLPSMLDALDAAVNSFVLFRRRKIQDALEMYVSTVEDLYRRQLDVLTRSLAVRLYATWTQHLGTLRADLDRLRVRLEALKDRYRTRRRQMESFKETGDFVLERFLVTEQDVEEFYRERVTDLRDETARLLNHPRYGRVYEWRTLSEEEIDVRLRRYCEEKFADLQNLHVDGPEGLLAQKNLSPDEILDRLMTFAVPFWNYSEVRARGINTATIEVVGVEDEDNSLIAEAVQRRPGDITTATTRESDRITVTRARHGLPLFALTMMENWKLSYDMFLRARRRPVHVLENWEDLPEPLPAEGEERARTIFALALAPVYGFVEKVGEYYCVVGEDRRDPDAFLELAEDRTTAEDLFVRNEELVEEVGRRITRRNRELGNVEIMARLQEYVADLAPPTPELERQIEGEKKRIGKYLEGLEA